MELPTVSQDPSGPSDSETGREPVARCLWAAVETGHRGGSATYVEAPTLHGAPVWAESLLCRRSLSSILGQPGRWLLAKGEWTVSQGAL